MMNELLTIDGLSIRLPEGGERDYALRDLDLSVHQDELICVVGESGSGKSLTVSAIMRQLPPRVEATTGRILFGGEDLLKADEARMRDLRGREISMVFQEPMTALNPLMPVGRQVGEMYFAHGASPRDEIRDRVVAMFDEVGLPNPRELLRSYPHQLSGGQRQRVMIAMALALEPRLLLADEPTTALDVTTQAQVLDLIRQLRVRHRMGIIFITHDFGVVAEIADRVVVMRRGLVVEAGTADEVLNRPQDPYTRGLIASVPRLAARPPRDFKSKPILFEACGLSKTYRQKGLFSRRETKAVDDISFTVRKGETLGIVGESGSGKSSLARVLSCLMRPDAGQILVDGLDLGSLGAAALREARSKVQIVFQDPFGSLNPRFNVEKIVASGPMAHGASRLQAKEKVLETLKLVGLGPTALERYPHEFSGGQRQRIAIARALALEPDVLIADESVSALDVSIQDQVLKLLADLRERLHLTILFITHDLRVASQICDTIAVMQKGKVVEYGEAADVFENPRNPYTRQLLGSVPGRDWVPPVSSMDDTRLAANGGGE